MKLSKQDTISEFGAGLVRELALVVILSNHESTLSRRIWIGYSKHTQQLDFTGVLQKRVPPKTSRLKLQKRAFQTPKTRTPKTRTPETTYSKNECPKNTYPKNTYPKSTYPKNAFSSQTPRYSQTPHPQKSMRYIYKRR